MTPALSCESSACSAWSQPLTHPPLSPQRASGGRPAVPQARPPGQGYSQVGLPRPEPRLPSSGERLAANRGGGGNGGGGGVIRSGTWGWTGPVSGGPSGPGLGLPVLPGGGGGIRGLAWPHLVRVGRAASWNRPGGAKYAGGAAPLQVLSPMSLCPSTLGNQGSPNTPCICLSATSPGPLKVTTTGTPV